MRPEITTVGSDEAWLALARTSAAEAGGTVIVHTASAAPLVERCLVGLPAVQRWQIAREPACEDFARFDAIGGFRPGLVIGVGGGRALDAAKVVAHWGRAFADSQGLRALLAAGGRPSTEDRARLLLAPTIASSGSESSRGAIVTLGPTKTGLRGPSLQPDLVIHDPRLWASLDRDMAMHFVFDVFSHLAETVMSLRRQPATEGFAAEGADRLFRWLFTQQAAPSAYAEAMHAAYLAGLCLASSGTCLPHRLQYVIGPATGTGHVEGVWMLSPRWMSVLQRRCPARLEEMAAILQLRRHGFGGVPEIFTRIHGPCGATVRRDRFAWTPADVDRLVDLASGDLAADPGFEGRETLVELLQPFTT